MENRPTNTTPKEREISNANLFSDQICFSDTENILFEEDLTSPTPTPTDNANPADRYKPTKKLNQGGMKAIWEVEDQRTARNVAMALIQDSKIASQSDIESFLYEARLTANLQHPNIIPIYDIAHDENGNPFFTMKALKGETLSQILQKKPAEQTFSRPRLIAIFLRICNAINYAHTKGVVHLDLKPSNVNIGDFGETHVLDWGLSTLITHLNATAPTTTPPWQSLAENQPQNGQTLTRHLNSDAQPNQQNNIGGTPGYMAPEQARAIPSQIDFRTDIYALGALLYEILTNQCPIEGKTIQETLSKTVRGDFTPPNKRAPQNKIPPPLNAIVLKAMATDPDDRYQTVSAMISDLHHYQEGYATTAENPTFITHLTLLIKRHKLAVSLISATLLIISAVLFQSFRSIQLSEKITRKTLAQLRDKNTYIQTTAIAVAPNYLTLAQQHEKNFHFKQAQTALETGLTFNPELTQAWLLKAKILISQNQFNEAWKILSGAHGHTPPQHPSAIRLAKKYQNNKTITDAQLPQLIKDLIAYDLADTIPRLFHHLNQSPFNPETRFPALKQTLQILNPKLTNIEFSWYPIADTWIIDISNNPQLFDISPLCGLKIAILNANHIGDPNLNLITQSNLVELRLRGTPINKLFTLNQIDTLQSLDISQTHITDLSNIYKYKNLRSLNISGIQDLTITSNLSWNNQLKLLTIDETHRNNRTINNLKRRGTIITFTPTTQNND